MRSLLLAFLVLLVAATPAAALTAKVLDFAVETGPGGDVACTITARIYTPDGASSADPVPASTRDSTRSTRRSRGTTSCTPWAPTTRTSRSA